MHRTSRSRAAALALFAFLASTTAGFAQPPEGDEAPEAPSTIYVPYKNLKGVFDKLGASVVMPYDEWLKLWQRDGGMEMPEPQKVDAVITAAAYTATIEKDLARIQARLTVNVLGKPWVEIPIRFGEAAVGKVEGAGDKECVVTGGKGTMAVSFKGQTYYVCCSGCKQAFDDDPEGVIAEYKARVAKRAKP